jgi:hypothetical protein
MKNPFSSNGTWTEWLAAYLLAGVGTANRLLVSHLPWHKQSDTETHTTDEEKKRL